MKTNELESCLRALILPALLHPASLVLETNTVGTMLIISFTTHPEDMGKVIGKGGNNVMALKALMTYAGARSGLQVRLVGNEPQPGPMGGNPPWSLELCQAGIQSLLDTAFTKATAVVTAGRAGKAFVMINGDLPEELEIPLSRWVHVMGGKNISLAMDDNAVFGAI